MVGIYSDNPGLFIFVAIVLGLAVILFLAQITSSLKFKKSLKANNPQGSIESYQIVSKENDKKYLANAMSPVDEFVIYTPSAVPFAHNSIINTVKSSGAKNEISTWWEFIKDPGGREVYRIRSLITRKYISFQEENFYENYKVKLWTYLTVEEDQIGDPNVSGIGWFQFIRTSVTKGTLGYSYKIKCLEPERTYLTTSAKWNGRNTGKWVDFFYSDDNTQKVTKPLQIDVVHARQSSLEEFFIKKKFPFIVEINPDDV